MDDKLLDYYERELTFVRKTGAEFARKYPKVAGRLQLEPDKCDDPHTERLIEAFAFLCGRIHKKIDDDFPEITESLLNILCPHYINPIPAMTIVQYEPVKQNIPPAGYKIEKNSKLYSKPVEGSSCEFSNRYPVDILPVEVTAAGWREPHSTVNAAQQAICIELRTFNNLSISQLGWHKLRFYLNGPHQHVFPLYELLFNNVIRVECEIAAKKGKPLKVDLGPKAITPVGFDADEGMMPYPRRSFPGYLLLFEYFCFPEKFLFFDLNGLERAKGAGLKDRIDIWIYLNKTAKSKLVINKDTFALNVTPAVNLFKRIAEPIRLEHRKTEYRVIPDIRRQDTTEVHSIERVTAASVNAPGKKFDFRPFYSIRHHLQEGESGGGDAFWHFKRQPSARPGDAGSEVFLSFTDLGFNAVAPETEVVTVHVNCTNRDLPARLAFGDANGDFDMESAAPVTRIVSMMKPTPARRSNLGGGLQWRLISHLSLNHLSLERDGENAFKEILKLYDVDDSPVTRQQIEGIVSIRSEHITRRIGSSFCRGVRITIEFDENKFVGAGLYLFASVLEKFLGQYVSINSFTQLVAKTIQRKEPLRIWAPRNGNRTLL